MFVGKLTSIIALSFSTGDLELEAVAGERSG